VVRELYRPFSENAPPLPATPEVGRIWLGRLRAEEVSALGDGGRGAAVDEVVLAVQRTSPQPWVEVQCHGGAELVRWLLETLQTRGVRVCSWQELEQWTAEEPGRAEAEAALVRAPTLRTAAILLDQVHGALQRAVEAMQTSLRDGDSETASRLVERLAGYVRLGRHLTCPWRLAVLGAPNVGKSSLVNAVAGHQRCVVAPTPGTTRDVVATLTAIDGWPVEFADTAGLRDPAGVLEAEGIARGRTTAAAADLCLWVLDASAAPVWPAVPMDAVQLVVNKIDLQAAWDLDRAADAVRVSALTGAGLAELCTAISTRLVPAPPRSGAAVPFTDLWCDRVREAWRLCRAGRVGDGVRVLTNAAVPSPTPDRHRSH
jgi:tRNA modification GTPase